MGPGGFYNEGVMSRPQSRLIASQQIMSNQKSAILIVENDAATVQLYQRELGRTYRVVASADARQALALLSSEAIDAVVLEPAAFDENGWDLLAAMADQQQGHATPIVVCSVLDERRRGMNLGAAAYLVKPVLPVTLLDTLHNVLQG